MAQNRGDFNGGVWAATAVFGPPTVGYFMRNLLRIRGHSRADHPLGETGALLATFAIIANLGEERFACRPATSA